MEMTTPICDFVRDYCSRNRLRLHMPGHKGRPFLGMEAMDITEIPGAGVLYGGEDCIAESEANAAALFGSGRTLYSCEGSSLCIRAMVFLVKLYAQSKGQTPSIAACRNAHKTFVSAAAVLDVQVQWLYPREGSLVCCGLTAQQLEARFAAEATLPTALYVTSPDYLGNTADIAALSRVCRKYGVLLLADNAHGAYLQFLPESRHPMALGADLCCDSAHKTLPVLTGGAYLHISAQAPRLLREQADYAMGLFASTSPSYLILQSLDYVNLYLAGEYPQKLVAFCEKAAALKQRLQELGYRLAGSEPLKLTLLPKPYGYTGDELARLLRESGIEPEFSDPDSLVLMLTPELTDGDLALLENALTGIFPRSAIEEPAPPIAPARQVCSPAQALTAPRQLLPLEQCLGRTMADLSVSCPPAIPIVLCGEQIGPEQLQALRYYGAAHCWVCL